MLLTMLLATSVVLAPRPAPIIVPPPLPVSAIVVNGRDQPLAGAEVYHVRANALDGREHPDGPPMPIVWKGKTDDAGRFVLDRAEVVSNKVPLPPYEMEHVFVTYPGMQPTERRLPAWSVSDKAAVTMRIRLRSAAEVPVRVIGPDGSPIAGARAYLYPDGEIGWALPIVLGQSFVATTAADGRANLTAFDATGSALCDVTAPGFGRQTVRWEIDAKGEKVLRLRAAGQLSVRVLADDPAIIKGVRILGGVYTPDANGLPILGAMGYIDARTGSDGRLSIPAVAAGVLSAIPVDLPNQYIVSRMALGQRISVGQTTVVEVSLMHGIPVRGILRERGSSRPIARALVRVRCGSPRLGFDKTARTDDEGYFEVFLRPGPVQVNVIYAGPYFAQNDAMHNWTTVPKEARSYELPPTDLVRRDGHQADTRD